MKFGQQSCLKLLNPLFKQLLDPVFVILSKHMQIIRQEASFPNVTLVAVEGQFKLAARFEGEIPRLAGENADLRNDAEPLRRSERRASCGVYGRVITSFGDDGRTNFTFRAALASKVSETFRVARSIFLFQYPSV